MLKLGAGDETAENMGKLLLAADYRGHLSHGLNRLEMYIRDVQAKTCDPLAKPTILKESPATAWVDGNNTLGGNVGTFCMNIAIKKAREVGVGWVSCRGSNHNGIAGYYSMMASDQGLLGMAFTNTSPLVASNRGKKGFIGTNPISLAAPGKEDDSFVLDMATSAVAVGKIELQRRKGEPIPNGWAKDQNGENTTDPTAAMKSPALYPLGGEESSSGYKGMGLGMLVEIFCGILGGSLWGPNVRPWMNTTDIANFGQCYIAIDPNCFAPDFPDRLQDLMNATRSQEPAEANKPVLVAGDPERAHMKRVDSDGGITYNINQITNCQKLAEELGVEPMRAIN